MDGLVYSGNRFLEFWVSNPGGSIGDSSQAEAIRSSGDLTVNKNVGLSPFDSSPNEFSATESTYDTSSSPLSVSRTKIFNEIWLEIGSKYLGISVSSVFHRKAPKTRKRQVLKFLIRIKVMNSSAQQTRFLY